MTETQLPPQSDFYSNLTEEGVSDSDYLHAQNVWNQFRMTSFKQYHDLYLQTDVLLLADVLNNLDLLLKTHMIWTPSIITLYQDFLGKLC